MKKTITFSLFGNIQKYTIGMQKNIELLPIIYPGWDIEVYHNNTVYTEWISKYNNYANVKTIDMTGSNIPGMFWRFLCNSDIFISRDTDSRLSIREKLAVDEWLKSGKTLHVIKDHIAHAFIVMPGGMWGFNRTTHELYLDFEKTIQLWLSKNINTSDYGKDQLFLRSVFNFYAGQDNVYVHDSLGSPNSHSFPTGLAPDYHFVGEVFDECDIRNPQHYQDWLNHREYEVYNYSKK